MVPPSALPVLTAPSDPLALRPPSLPAPVLASPWPSPTPASSPLPLPPPLPFPTLIGLPPPLPPPGPCAPPAPSYSLYDPAGLDVTTGDEHAEVTSTTGAKTSVEIMSSLFIITPSKPRTAALRI